MARVKSEMSPLQNALPAVAADLLKRGPMSAEKMAFAWRIAVGGGLSRVTSAQLRPQGILLVVAADERWRREISRSQRLILTRLQGLLGADVVTGLEVISKRPESRISRSRSHAKS